MTGWFYGSEFNYFEHQEHSNCIQFDFQNVAHLVFHYDIGVIIESNGIIPKRKKLSTVETVKIPYIMI